MGGTIQENAQIVGNVEIYGKLNSLVSTTEELLDRKVAAPV
jgi:hypothetical protein